MISERAKVAFKHVQQASTQPYKKEYKQHIKKLPQIIHTNGLIQTMAFVKAKAKEKDFQQIFDNISHLAKHEGYIKGDILQDAIQLDSDAYRRLTQAVMDYLHWAKRFAEAEIRED
ncbi:MAG: type III-B CRISPR module-associated protein Cmr5 [Leptospiraceae bacterium]|nr:type III-B CRISPR module-associated protein Cmr5 [Leptospiraceae bacterium]